MKKSFLKKIFAALSVTCALCVSCKQEEDTPVIGGAVLDQALIDAQTIVQGTDQITLSSGITSCTLPSWSKNPAGYSNLPDAVTDGSASNVTKEIKAGVSKLPAKIDVKNIVIMFFNGLTEELAASAEAKYGELITNDLPVKMNFTAAALDSNTSASNIIGLYLQKNCYVQSSYITTGCIANDVFRQFKGSKKSTDSVSSVADDLFTQLPRPLLILGKDTDARSARNSWIGNYLNEFYKSRYKFIETFTDAISCYNNDEVFFEAADDGPHGDKKGRATGVYAAYDPASSEIPSLVQSVAYGLAHCEMHLDPDIYEGFCAVVYDDAQSEDKEAALKNFDESVAVAAKYVLENPDTVLIVTSGVLDGSSIPAYALGNIPEEAVSASKLYDFVKAAVKVPQD